MTFDHIVTLAVAMPCRACDGYADTGMHQGPDGHWYHPQCCPAPACVAARVRVAPLAAGEIKPVEGAEQGGLFDGD